MLLTTLLITSVCVNIALAIHSHKKKSTIKDLQFKVKAMQGWAEEAHKKIKKLEDTRNSLLEHMANAINAEKPVKQNSSAKKSTRRSSKKPKK
tara:strand:- start:815 stop:1093 length:279 start_codon:yes stop_codon:yes gene_type:complete